MVKDNIIIPYCISIFDGFENLSFYLTHFKSPEDMLKQAILSILRKKYDDHIVYVHNLSNFDGIFLLKILSSLKDVKIDPILKNGRMINIKLKFKHYQISFRDSYLILPLSLDKLAKSINYN